MTPAALQDLREACSQAQRHGVDITYDAAVREGLTAAIVRKRALAQIAARTEARNSLIPAVVFARRRETAREAAMARAQGRAAT